VTRRTRIPPPSITTPSSAAAQTLSPVNGSCLPAGSTWPVVVPLEVEDVVAVVAVVPELELVLEAAVEPGVEDDALELDGADVVGDELEELLWFEL
jgi:hypothetical protein